jgi:hypothetical protein
MATVEEGREARTDAVILRIARRVNERVLFTQHLASVALHSAVHPTGVAPLSASLAQLSLDVEHALLTPCRELSHSPLTHTHTHTQLLQVDFNDCKRTHPFVLRTPRMKDDNSCTTSRSAVPLAHPQPQRCAPTTNTATPTTHDHPTSRLALEHSSM